MFYFEIDDLKYLPNYYDDDDGVSRSKSIKDGEKRMGKYTQL
jgi:hypothetical protein